MTQSATQWPWERLERGNVGSQTTLIALLDPQPGERFLDVGTGSGGLALLGARTGATVTGLDVAADGVARASERARAEGLDVTFEVGDAQSLSHPDGSFDVVASAYGVNFALDHRRAALELARVTAPGGRLGLLLMPSESRTAGVFTLLRAFGGEHGDHPAAFADRVDELLGEWFELDVRLRETTEETSSGAEHSWEDALEGFAPLRHVVAKLTEDRVAELRAQLEAHFARWEGRPATYVLALGRRR
ncbi:MAG TPA: class I SAM-dependent methyltransferase [Gaiellaceae bacterium]|nr:class I SAM-dependent methyltransferase [Gaiellaceae bacterium]